MLYRLSYRGPPTGSLPGQSCLIVARPSPGRASRAAAANRCEGVSGWTGSRVGTADTHELGSGRGRVGAGQARQSDGGWSAVVPSEPATKSTHGFCAQGSGRVDRRCGRAKSWRAEREALPAASRGLAVWPHGELAQFRDASVTNLRAPLSYPPPGGGWEAGCSLCALRRRSRLARRASPSCAAGRPPGRPQTDHANRGCLQAHRGDAPTVHQLGRTIHTTPRPARRPQPGTPTAAPAPLGRAATRATCPVSTSASGVPSRHGASWGARPTACPRARAPRCTWRRRAAAAGGVRGYQNCSPLNMPLAPRLTPNHTAGSLDDRHEFLSGKPCLYPKGSWFVAGAGK